MKAKIQGLSKFDVHLVPSLLHDSRDEAEAASSPAKVSVAASACTDGEASDSALSSASMGDGIDSCIAAAAFLLLASLRISDNGLRYQYAPGCKEHGMNLSVPSPKGQPASYRLLSADA